MQKTLMDAGFSIKTHSSYAFLRNFLRTPDLMISLSILPIGRLQNINNMGSSIHHWISHRGAVESSFRWISQKGAAETFGSARSPNCCGSKGGDGDGEEELELPTIAQ